MRKSLLALAVGVAVLPLTAQAATDFYGRLNVSLDNVAATPFISGVVLPPGVTIPSTFGPASSSWDVSSTQDWVGIKGEVPLYGQNLNAIYQLERGVDMTNGDGTFSTRNTYVGLAGNSWGKLFFGTYDGIVKQAEGSVDQFNNTGADMTLYIGGQNRYDNTINYSSPSFSGLSFNAQIIPGEGKRQDATKDPIGVGPAPLFTPIFPSEHGLMNAYGASVNFKQDTFWANLAYEKRAESALTGLTGYMPLFTMMSFMLPPGTDIASVYNGIDMGVSTLRLTAGLTIGNLNLAVLAQQRKANSILGTEVDARNDYLLSGSFAVTDRLKLKAQYADAAGYFLLKDDNRTIHSYTVGADYALSKNVTSYILYSNNSINGSSNASFFGFGKDESVYNLASAGLEYKF